MLERVQPRMDFSIRLHCLLDLDPQLPVLVRERGVQRGRRDRVTSAVWYLVECLQNGRRLSRRYKVKSKALDTLPRLFSPHSEPCFPVE